MTSKQLIADCKAWYLKLLKGERPDEATCEELDRAFHSFSQADKNDSEVRVYHILSSFMMSVGYFDQIIERIKKEAIISKKDFHLIVIIACIEDLIVGGIHHDTLAILNSMNEADLKRQSTIEVLKSWHYEFTAGSEYADSLEKAFKFDQAAPQAAVQFGRYLIKKGFQEQGKRLLGIGVSNIQHILLDNEKPLRELDPEAFIDCYIKGFCCSGSEYKRCQADLLR